MMQSKTLKFRIYSFEVRCAALISHGLVSKKGKQPILRELKKELLAFRSTVKLTESEANQLWVTLVNTYISISRTVWSKRTDNETVYRAIRTTLPHLERFKNQFGLDIENRRKLSYLHSLEQDKIFYLCSSHPGCAKDHEAYQGKIYVSENWRERCKAEDTKKIEAYIKNHHCMTIEAVTNAPVYMMTRPNCRHYFISVGVEEVLTSSAKKILKKHHMIQSEGKDSYVYSQYRVYYERLKLMQKLRDVCPCLILEKDIKETQKLTKKWLSMLSR